VETEAAEREAMAKVAAKEATETGAKKAAET